MNTNLGRRAKEIADMNGGSNVPAWSVSNLFSRTEDFPDAHSLPKYSPSTNIITSANQEEYTTSASVPGSQQSAIENTDIFEDNEETVDETLIEPKMLPPPTMDPRDLPISLDSTNMNLTRKKFVSKVNDDNDNEQEQDQEHDMLPPPSTTPPENRNNTGDDTNIDLTSERDDALETNNMNIPPLEDRPVNQASLSISGVDRQLHDTATEQLERLRVSEDSRGAFLSTSAGAGTIGGADGTATSFSSSSSSSSFAAAPTSSTTGVPPASPNVYSDTHAVVREFFNHYSRSFDGNLESGSRSQLETSSAQRRVSRVGFHDFARDVGLLESSEHNATTSTVVLQRDHVEDVFVRTIEQQKRELNSYGHSAGVRNTSSFENSERLNTGLDYRSFHEATTELFAVMSHGERIENGRRSDDNHHKEMGEDVVRRLNETLGIYRARLVEDAAMLGDVRNNKNDGTSTSKVLMTPSNRIPQDRNVNSDSASNYSLASRSPSTVEISKVKRKLRAAGKFLELGYIF